MDEYARMVDCDEIQDLWKKDGSGQLVAVGYSGGFVDIHIYLPHQGVYDYADCHIWEIDDSRLTWLPRQEDWQNTLFSRHYAPAIPNTARKIQGAMIIMHREFVDYMESWKIDQPCKAWARLYMNRAHGKQWTDEGWQ